MGCLKPVRCIEHALVVGVKSQGQSPIEMTSSFSSDRIPRVNKLSMHCAKKSFLWFFYGIVTAYDHFQRIGDIY